VHTHTHTHARTRAHMHARAHTHTHTHTQVLHQLNNATDVFTETYYNTVVGSTYIGRAGKIINVNPEKIQCKDGDWIQLAMAGSYVHCNFRETGKLLPSKYLTYERKCSELKLPTTCTVLMSCGEKDSCQHLLLQVTCQITT